MIANVTVSSERYIINSDVFSKRQVEHNMELWKNGFRARKTRGSARQGPINFPIRLFGLLLPIPSQIRGASNTSPMSPERSGTKKPKQVPPPEAVERGNAETLAWVPYPPPLPSASFSSSWRSAVGREHHDKDTQESIIPCILYSKFLCGGKFVMDKPHA